MFRMRGGRAKRGENLCDTCSYCTRVDDRSYCRVLQNREGGPMPIPSPVSRCTDYDDKRLPALFDLRQQAWIFVDRPAQVGFVNPATYRDKFRREDEEQ